MCILYHKGISFWYILQVFRRISCAKANGNVFRFVGKKRTENLFHGNGTKVKKTLISNTIASVSSSFEVL
jgi:hypothetical protein